MRIKLLFTLFLVALSATIFVGCTKKNSDGAPIPTFEEFVFEEKVEGNAYVYIQYQRIQNADDSEALASIDTMNYRRTFAERIEEPITVIDLEGVAKAICEEVFADGSLSGQECESRIEQQPIIAREGRILCFETSYYSFMGGAHGYESLIYDCYDITSGSLYDFAYLVEDAWGEAVQHLIYNKARADYAEQLFPNVGAADIYIPESVLITETGLLLVYQPYEIGPYSSGIITVELTDEAIAATGAPLVWIKDVVAEEVE